MITNIYLVRHAHSTYSIDEQNRPLSQKGLIDAKRVTELFSHESITHIISSPYKRAIQTVEGIAHVLKLKIQIDDGLKERKLSDTSVLNFEEAVLLTWENFDFTLPDGESNYHAQQRGVHSLQRVINEYCGGNIVIGTHGNIMALILNHYDKKFDHTFWSQLNMPDIYKLCFNDQTLFEVKQIWK